MNDMAKIKTSDLFCAAYLLTRGARLTKVLRDYESKGRYAFEFQDPHILGFTNDYVAGKAQANVLELKSSLKHLKDLLQNKVEFQSY